MKLSEEVQVGAIISGLIILLTTAIFAARYNATKEERQKWCQHYHVEFKAVESCLYTPDYEAEK
jgi:hypothetical protein